MHARVVPQPVDQLEQLRLRGAGGEPVAERRHADLATGPLLAPDVHLRRRIVADEHGRQPGNDAAAGQPGHALPDLASHRRRNCFAVDRPSHASFPTFAVL